MKYQLLHSKNKVTVLFIEAENTQDHSVGLYCNVGSGLESEYNYGVNHLLGKLLLRHNLKDFKNSFAFKLEELGCQYKVNTSFDQTHFSIRTLPNKIKDALFLLLDSLLNLNITQEDFLYEKEESLNEYKQYIDSSSHFLMYKIITGIFPFPYNHPFIGTDKNITSLGLKDVEDFKNNFYTNSNLLLYIHSDFKIKEALTQILENFKIAQGAPNTFQDFYLPNKNIIDIHNKDVKEASLLLLVSSDYSQSNLNEFLCFLLETTFNSLQKDFRVTLESHTQSIKKTNVHFLKFKFASSDLQKTLDIIFTLFEELYSQGVSDSDSIKEKYLLKKALEEENSSKQISSFVLDFIRTDRPKTTEEKMQEINELKTYEVEKALRDIIEGTLHMVLQLPRRELKSHANLSLEEFQKKLKSRIKVLKKDILKIQKNKAKFQCSTLSLGLNLLFKKDPKANTSLLKTYIQGGTIFETPQNNGIHELYCRIIKKMVSKKYESQTYKFRYFLDTNVYGFELLTLKKDFLKHTQGLLQTFLHFDLSEKEIETEKQELFKQIEARKDDPFLQAMLSFKQMCFFNHPYALDLKGRIESVSSITPNDLNDLHQSSLEQKKIIFAANGDINEVKLQNMLTNSFASTKRESMLSDPIRRLIPLEGKKHFLYFANSLSHILIGIPSSGIDSKEAFCLKILFTHFLSCFSELVQIKKNLSLTRSIYPICKFYKDAGLFCFHAQVLSDKVKPCCQELVALFENLFTKGISKKNFKHAKKILETKTLISSNQSTQIKPDFYTKTHTLELEAEFQIKVLEEIKKLTFEEFFEFLQKLSSRKFNIVISGKTDIS